MLPSTATRPSVEIRVPISANEQFFRMLHYFLASLKTFGGPLVREARCVVSLSADTPERDIRPEVPWADDYPVEFRWMDRELFRRLEYHGTGLDRFYVESDADIVMLTDADLIVAGDFDYEIMRAHETQTLLGFIAHVSPFTHGHLSHIPSNRWWNWIYEEAGLPKPVLRQNHTGWGVISPRDRMHRRCPDYFNAGVIVAPRRHIETIGETFEMELEYVDRVVETDFKSQIAFTLGQDRHAIPVGTLSINCNFSLNADERRIRAINPDPRGLNKSSDICIFHYLGNKGEVHKGQFADREQIFALLEQADLSPAGTLFQEKLRVLAASIEQ